MAREGGYSGGGAGEVTARFWKTAKLWAAIPAAMAAVVIFSAARDPAVPLMVIPIWAAVALLFSVALGAAMAVLDLAIQKWPRRHKSN